MCSSWKASGPGDCGVGAARYLTCTDHQGVGEPIIPFLRRLSTPVGSTSNNDVCGLPNYWVYRITMCAGSLIATMPGTYHEKHERTKMSISLPCNTPPSPAWLTLLLRQSGAVQPSGYQSSARKASVSSRLCAAIIAPSSSMAFITIAGMI